MTLVAPTPTLNFLIVIIYNLLKRSFLCRLLVFTFCIPIVWFV